MIDIHSHVIPAIDDGCRSIEESVTLATREQEGGTRAFIATPHVNSKLDLDKSPALIEKVAQLNADYEAAGLSVRVLPGAELFCSQNILTALDEQKPISMAGTGRYLLIDSPHTSLPLDFRSVLFELVLRGLTPILAHPERCGAFQLDPNEVYELRDRGVALQLNAKSFEGKYGPRAKELAYQFFDKRIAHFLASDAHRPGEFPILGSVVDLLRTPDNADYLNLITNRSGEAVSMGQPLPELPAAVEIPTRVAQSNWFKRTFLSRK